MFTYKLKKLYRYKMIPFLILFSIIMGVVSFFLHFKTTNHAFDFLTSSHMSISNGISWDEVVIKKTNWKKITPEEPDKESYENHKQYLIEGKNILQNLMKAHGIDENYKYNKSSYNEKDIIKYTNELDALNNKYNTDENIDNPKELRTSVLNGEGYINFLKERNSVEDKLIDENDNHSFSKVIFDEAGVIFGAVPIILLGFVMIFTMREDDITSVTSNSKTKDVANNFGIIMCMILMYIFISLLTLLVASLLTGNGVGELTYHYDSTFVIRTVQDRSGSIREYSYVMRTPLSTFLKSVFPFALITMSFGFAFSFVDKLIQNTKVKYFTLVLIMSMLLVDFNFFNHAYNPLSLFKSYSIKPVISTVVMLLISAIGTIFLNRRKEFTSHDTYKERNVFSLKGSVKNCVVSFNGFLIMFVVCAILVGNICLQNNWHNFNSTQIKNYTDLNSTMENLVYRDIDEIKAKYGNSKRAKEMIDSHSDALKFYENENKYFDAYENRYKTPQKFNNVNKERVTEFNGFDFQGTGSETTGMVDVFNDFALEGAFFKQKYMLINNITPTDRFYIPQSGIDYNPFDVDSFKGTLPKINYYITHGISERTNAFAMLHDYFYLKFNVVLIVFALLLFTSTIIKSNKQLELKSVLPVSRTKSYKSKIIESVIYAIGINIVAALVLFLAGGIMGGFADSDFPIINYIVDGGIIYSNVGPFVVYILESFTITVLFTIFISMFVNSMYTATNKLFTILISIIAFIVPFTALKYMGVIGSFIPFNYVDSGFVTTGFLSALIRQNSYTMVMAVVVLVISSILFYVLGRVSFGRRK
ncbi:hypothetical protein HMPREF9261_1545 [Finegoldia magna ACS-171-V-Col3]|uniref:ABC transporter permease n=1 Tax=Finegoldia magna TaxID=1260 RepID=UPI0001DE4A09|nr:ABC transporter permease [Finegoldia magna]EFK93382.1 hypothetical protein HMPREF9261_1545 [Finegoldia magna ACS-171-V-Col3]